MEGSVMFYKKIFVFLFLIFSTSLAIANDTERYQVVDGMSIYLGVIPTQLIKDHADMHDGTTDKEHTYHILIAIFDNKSDKRIRNVKVKATAIPLGMKGETKNLEPMHGNLRSFGNYFTLSKTTPYTINIEIIRPENKVKSIAKFIFNRPRD